MTKQNCLLTRADLKTQTY